MKAIKKDITELKASKGLELLMKIRKPVLES